MTPHDALVLDRFLLTTALSVVWGGSGFMAIASGQARSRLGIALRMPLLGSAAVAAVAAMAAVPVQTAEIASGWGSALQADIIATVALKTGVGLSTSLQAAAALALLAVLWADRATLTIILAGLALAETATHGHAAASLDPPGYLRMAVMAIHVLSAAAWVGALIPFVMTVGMTRHATMRGDAVAAMVRFSSFGHIAVALVLTTGAANVLLIPGRLSWDVSSPYQIELLAKITAVAAMTSIAVANRYLIVPLSQSRPATTGTLLIAGATLEIALGLIAFALVASFGLESPTA
jgi:putative copper resistance protein D